MSHYYLTPDPTGLRGGLAPFTYAKNNPLSFIDLSGLTPQDRVNWAFNELQTNAAAWAWNNWDWPPHNKCNEFVYAAHVTGDPDATDFPTVLREDGYTYPTTADYANPAFVPQRLLYDNNINHVQPGDIISWYSPGGAHHNALFVGGNDVIYAADIGAKKNNISAVTEAMCVQPILRRYIY